MGTVTKTLPYEILIRFSEGAPHQNAPVGEFEAAHYIERTRFVDEATGDIVGTPRGEEIDHAVPLPRDKVIGILGKPFVEFEEQQRKRQDKLEAAVSALAKSEELVAALTKQVEELSAQRAAVKAAMDQLLA